MLSVYVFYQIPPRGEDVEYVTTIMNGEESMTKFAKLQSCHFSKYDCTE